MRSRIAFVAGICLLALCSCSKKENPESAQQANPQAPAATQAGAPAQPAAGPRATVILKDGSKVPGSIVASTQTDMTVAGDDGIEHKIPLAQVKSVQYGEPETKPPAKEPARERSARPPAMPAPSPTATPEQAAAPRPREHPAVTTRTYELPVGTQVSVRTNETIDSATAAEGQTFDAQVTRDAQDANGDVVIPRGADARVVIKSASQGGRIRGASDLVLDLQSVTIDGKRYTIDTAEVAQKGKSGIGANKRTATYTGGGAAIGAIIGAIAGGGKGAAIGAGAGAGAGALTQVLTKGKAIKVPAESVLTFSLDKPLHVTAAR